MAASRYGTSTGRADPRQHHCGRRCDFGADLGRHRQTRHPADAAERRALYACHDRRRVRGVVAQPGRACWCCGFGDRIPVLDVWLMVVMCAWLFDIALSAIFNAARFDLGFYAGRIYGLCAASFVLAVLLIDNVGLQAQIARLLATLRRAGRLGARSSLRARAAVQRGGGILQRRDHHQDARRHHHRLESGRGTPVRLYRGRSRRQSHRHHRSAGPARRGARNPRSSCVRAKRSNITKPCGCTRTAARCTSR